MKLAYTVTEAAEATGMSVSTIRQLIRDNKLAARRHGSKTILITEGDLRAYLEALPEVA